MSFDVTIVFTGICSFIPRDITVGSNLSFAYCVVLPNGWPTDFCSVRPLKGDDVVDGISTIAIHRPFLTFDASSHQGAGHLADITGLYFLEGKRVLVLPNEGVKPPPPPLPVCSDGDIDGLASVDDVTSSTTRDLLKSSDAVLNPDPCRVGAQVILEHGVVNAPVNDITWVFENTLSRQEPKSKALSYEVKVTLAGLDSLTLRVKDLFAPNALIKDIVVDKAAIITIGNLCINDPLRWLGPPAKDALKPDEDFRLHYEIVDDRDALFTELMGLPSPIPRVDPTSAGGNGFDCFPKRFSSVDFDPLAWR